MPPLDNPRQERFAQELADGKPATEAHRIAGYAGNSGNASRLQRDDTISARVAELLEERARMAAIATERAIEKLSLTKEMVLGELKKIGFADIRNAVEWQGTLIQETDQPDGGDVLVVRSIVSNHVRLKSSNEIDDATAAAIAEVRQSPQGGLSIKFHDKQAALLNLGRHLGCFVERVELSGPNGNPIEMADVTARELVERRIAGLAARGESKPTEH